MNVAFAMGAAALVGLSVSIARRDDRERAEWAVGAPRVATENRVRTRYGVRLLDAGWRLEDTYDAEDGLRGYIYTHDGRNGRETKQVERDAKSGALVTDQDEFLSGRDYRDPEAGTISELVYVTFDLRAGDYTDLTYFGNDEKLDALAHGSFPANGKNVRQFLDAMREAAIAAPGGPRGR